MKITVVAKRSLAFFLLALSTGTGIAQNFKVEKIPAWVQPVEIPEKSSVNKYDVLSGFYQSVFDYQINLETNSYFNREVMNVVSYSGITNVSQISVTYDTTYQKLVIHHLYIWRKGKKIDRTPELSFEKMNNEYNLHQGIYTGKITAYDILNDIRKDDLIDFAYTLTGDNPIFNNEKFLFIPLEGMNPIDLLSVRVMYPNTCNYTFKTTGPDSLLTDTLVNNYRQLSVTRKNIAALKMEEQTPAWDIQYSYFLLTSMKNWTDVNTWATSVFALATEPDLKPVFDEIFTGSESTDEKINKIINYVQDDIRYMGIESGIGSIKPFPPDQVVKQRYGDCKDKSLLLVWLLKKIGVTEAFPALVNVDLQAGVEDLFPTNEIFNHCIVTFNYTGKTYWVDPTMTLQGGDFKDLYMAGYKKALVIGQPSDSLQTMEITKNSGFADVVDEYTIPSFTEPAELVITSKRSGFDADTRRSFFEYYSTKELTDQVTSELKLLFPTVTESKEVQIDDDIEKNLFTVIYTYRLNDFWKDGDKSSDVSSHGYQFFKFEPLTLYQFFSVSACEDRKTDCSIVYPTNLNYRVIFHFPQDLLINDETDVVENDAFYFKEKVEQTDSHSVQITYTFNTKTDHIDADVYKQICEQKNKISKELPVIFYFPK